MFENSCCENWNSHDNRPTHSGPQDRVSRLMNLIKGLYYLILLLQRAQIPQEQTEKLKNEALIEPSLNQSSSPSPGETGQLSTQRHGWFSPCCSAFHYFFGSVQKVVLLVTCHKQEIFILIRGNFHVLGKFPSCYKML